MDLPFAPGTIELSLHQFASREVDRLWALPPTPERRRIMRQLLEITAQPQVAEPFSIGLPAACFVNQHNRHQIVDNVDYLIRSGALPLAGCTMTKQQNTVRFSGTMETILTAVIDPISGTR